MPNQWASQAEGAQFSDPLSDQELVKLGREPFARKVAAREAGVDAWAGSPPTTAPTPWSATPATTAPT